MYGKIFDSIYSGTLYGQWEAIITFQQLIVLCDADGIVDMTPPAIAAITSIPLVHIENGLKVLQAPDPYSRTPGSEGRRLELIDEHRPWGWHIINHEKYKNLKDAEEVRAQNRERQQRFRDKGNVTPRNAPSRSVTPGNTKSRHTDTDTDTDTDTKTLKPFAPKPSASKPADSGEVVEKIPLNDNSEFEVRESFVSELDRLYPAVEPKQTLREIRGWCLGNPTKRKTVRGVKAFLTSWFAREQDKQSRMAN